MSVCASDSTRQKLLEELQLCVYCLETTALRHRQEVEVEVVEAKVSLAATRMDGMSSEDSRLQLTDAVEVEEGRLMVWTCTERDSESISGRM